MQFPDKKPAASGLFCIASLFFQRITDFTQQDDIFRWCSRSGGRLFFLMARQIARFIDHAHHLENDENQNLKVDQNSQEMAVGENRAGLFRLNQRQLASLAVQRQVVVRKIESAKDFADHRHDDILHQRFDDFAESTADNHTDSEVDNVALERESTKFLHHAHLFLL